MARAAGTSLPASSRPAGRDWAALAARLAGYSMLTFLSVLLIMLISGDRFATQLSYLGLYHRKGGLYTDCSDEENRDIRFCQPEVRPVDKNWQSLRRGKVTFNLSDR